MTFPINRRTFLATSAALAAPAVITSRFTPADEPNPKSTIRTVLGPVAPEKLGCTLMHEHAPIVDWSELYETPAAPLGSLEDKILAHAEESLRAFHDSLPADLRPGTIVELTPIRVGRYPDLLVKLARRVPIHIVGCTGFWCEAMAPQHPWALRLGLERGGVRRMAELFIREIREGMEDPTGKWGERFTDVKAGIIKCATSTYLRPSERRCHEAAAIASIETGCPITTHTTDGGGLEQAQLFLKLGVKPERIIIGHQGHKDDREHDEAPEYHKQIADLGCFVQFDRVGHAAYDIAKMGRLVHTLVAGGHAERVLLGHDHVPYVYGRYADTEKPANGWKEREADYSIVTSQLVPELRRLGVSEKAVRAIVVDSPRRVLSF
jgi:phosphotriesterase-related protein